MRIARSNSRSTGPRGRLLATALASAVVLLPGLSHAQQVNVVQRSFINLGFESPVLASAGCRLYINEAAVPGWTTDHPNFAQGSSATDGGTCTPFPAGYAAGVSAPIIELWRGPRGGGAGLVSARSGAQFAELNAERASRLSQNVCLENGDTVRWRLSHRGRTSATVPDVMRFLVGTTPIATMSSNNAGTGAAPTAAQGTVAVAAGPGNWRDYSGSFAYGGVSGVTNLGFEAISTGDPNNAALGNFLDDIQVTLRPFVELGNGAFSTVEGAATGLPSLSIAGRLDAPLQVLVRVAGGTAVRGTDYTTPGNAVQWPVTVPAGTYAGEAFPLGMNTIGNTLVENNRTVELEIVAQPDDYVARSTTVCGQAGAAAATWTIVDNDVDVRTLKTANPNTPEGLASFTVLFENNTAQPSVGPTNAHDAQVRITDALPAGFSAVSWTCAAGGTPTASCPAASGTGAINTVATLPAGQAGAAGGRLTYTVTGTFAAGQCAAVTNTSTIALEGSALEEGTAVGGGFATPAPGGTANNTASASAAPACGTVDLSMTKSVSPSPVQSGQSATWSLLVANAGPGAADGAVVQDPAVAGADCSAATVSCSATNNAACPSSGLTIAALQGAGIIIPTLPATGTVTLQFTCRVTASGTP